MTVCAASEESNAITRDVSHLTGLVHLMHALISIVSGIITVALLP